MRTLSLFLVGAGTLLGAAALSAQAPTATPRAQSGVDRQAGPRQGGRHGMNRGFGGGRGALRGFTRSRGALRGIILSDAQRTQLRPVADRYRTEQRTLRDQARAQWGNRNTAPGTPAARPDSAAREAFRGRVRALRERQLADVRNVLTADQRATFDRNVAELRTRAAEHTRGEGRGQRRDRGFRGAR